MLKRTLKFSGAALLILVPLLLRWAYLQYTALPGEISMATGPRGGQWDAVSASLKRNVEDSTSMRVRTYADHTEGAIQHLHLLEQGEVDFALYMRGAQQLEPRTEVRDGPSFVCNLYRDITLLLVRRDLYEGARIQSMSDLQPLADEEHPLRVAVGRESMGEYRLSNLLLTYYFGKNWQQVSWLEAVHWDYDQIEEGFRDGTLDAALITAGHQAPVFHRLLEEEPGLCKLGEIREVEALIQRNVALGKASVPRGLFRFRHESLPAEPMETVALQTVLLTHDKVPSRVVGEVLKVALSDNFIRENGLLDLSRGGMEAARSQPDFPMHPGASAIYDPHLKPLVDPDVIESTENLRSFAVSLLIAGFFAYRWWHKRAEGRKAHRLDDYVASLLEIDRSQSATTEVVDIRRLQKTLDRVVSLRNKALREFSARDFRDDPAADSFLKLCDTVAEGINARIIQQQMADGLTAIVNALDKRP